MGSEQLPPTSRYHGVGTGTHTGPDGRSRTFLRRRFVPPPERFALLTEHTVTGGDRLDRLTAQYLGDPEQFWRIADANGAVAPESLTDVAGARIRITLPAGVPGTDQG